MSSENLSSDPEVEQLNERLQGGLETYRFVMANYRSLLSNEQPTSLAGTEGSCGELGARSKKAGGAG